MINRKLIRCSNGLGICGVALKNTHNASIYDKGQGLKDTEGFGCLSGLRQVPLTRAGQV